MAKNADGTEQVVADPVVSVAQAPAAAPVRIDLSNPDVQRVIEHARTEEKQKLYSTIEMLKDEKKNVTKELDSIQKKLADIEKAKNLTEAEKAALEKTYQNQITELGNKFEELQTRFQIEKLEADKRVQEQELKAYKSEALRNAGTDLIPELVQGNTPQEIDASIVESKKRYAQMQADILSRANHTATPRATNPVITIDGKELTLADVKNMSPEEYRKNRDAIHALIKQSNAGQ